MGFFGYVIALRCKQRRTSHGLICDWVALWHITLTYSFFSRHHKFGREEEWTFASQKYLNTGVLTIDLSFFYFKRDLFAEITEVEWQILQDKKEESFNKHTFTHSHIHTTTTPHHKRTSSTHIWIWLPLGFVMFVVMLCINSTSFIFLF